jgi:uncharacterized protein (DUF427 family)
MVKRIPPGPGQESVWDYPRPPRLEPTSRRIRVLFAGITLVDSRRAIRVLETSHPPVYYIPADDIRMEFLRPNLARSLCEFKGVASYYDVVVGERIAPQAAWSYLHPTPAFEAIRGHLAFYAAPMDACSVGWGVSVIGLSPGEKVPGRSRRN